MPQHFADNRNDNVTAIQPQTANQMAPNMNNMSMASAAQAGAATNALPRPQTVSERLADITQEGGAYLTQARQRGLQQAAGRGLSDSSIAAQASQGEAIRAALPIAEREAQTQFEADQAERQRQFQERQTGLTTSANLQGQYATQAQGLLNQYAISINEIETAQNIPTATKNALIANEIKRRDADLGFLRQMYSALPTWQTNWNTLPTFPDAPGVQ